MEFLQKYGAGGVIQAIIIAGLAIKGFISFLEWIFPRLKKTIKRVDQPLQNEYNLKQQGKQIDSIKQSIDNLKEMIGILIQSDRDDIKAYITKQHHYFVYQKRWIDDYSLDCIEKRYNHYIKENGNSFIKSLMIQIRQLPKKPIDQS